MKQTGNGRTEIWEQPQSDAAASVRDPDDPRVIAALEAYVAALQAGKAPDRGEFQARYPQIAAVLGECLDGLEWMRGAPPRTGSTAAAGDGVGPGTPRGLSLIHI